MAAKKFIVELDEPERARLNALISKGKAPAKMILKARILLKADQAEGGHGWLDAQIVEALDTNLTMVSRVREKLVTEGLDAVLTRGGERKTRRVTGAGGKARVAAYGLVDAALGPTAIVEAAEIVGITDSDGMAVDVTMR